MLVHGTAIAMDNRAILLTGPTMSGKSDLALRALAAGAALIADDLVTIAVELCILVAARPTAAAPMLGVRGIGILHPDHVEDKAPLSLCVHLSPNGDHRSLTPQLAKAGPWYGLFVPQIMLNPFEDSAIAKLHLALIRFGH